MRPTTPHLPEPSRPAIVGRMKSTLVGLLGALLLVGAGCKEKSAEPAEPTASAAAAAPAAAVKPYPLNVCIVSDEELGSMGEPIVMVHEGQEVKFCCKSCVPDFEKEPAKFLTKLAGK